jgi:hypothetical protein
MAKNAAAKTWPHKAEAIAARIIPWAGDELGVAYDFADGKHTAHPIEADDWPIIRILEEIGRLTYASDAVRDLAVSSSYDHG